MAKKKVEIPEEKLALYDKLIDTIPEIERKGKTVPYTSHNGHMFTYLANDGTLGLRLSKVDREAFVDKYNTPPFVQYGAVMREYVTVPDDLFQDTETMHQYLKLSYAYIQTLQPD